MARLGGAENVCPQCGAAMTAGKWISQPGRRYMTMASCPQHGKYLLRLRLQPEPDGTYRVSKLLYEGDSEAAKTYERTLAAPSKRRRRRRRGKRPADSE